MENINVADWGTFKDSLKAPVYGWFTYPAGFSYKAVEYSLLQEKIKEGDTIYDPFMGSGTTNLTAKIMGVNSVGVEAHPFVFPIAKCKMNWDLNLEKIQPILKDLSKKVTQVRLSDMEKLEIVNSEFPELVLKCFLPTTLYELLTIRNFIREIQDPDVKLFLNTALIC